MSPDPFSADPEKYRREQIARRIPDDFDDLDEEDQQEIIAQLEDEVLSYDPAVLQEEIAQLNRLVEHAKQIEGRDVQSKLKKLRAVLMDQGIFANPQMKLLVFTEHKDTLDYLAADGKDGRPLGKLREWGLTITQIHGGMKIGDRDTPGSRICAEREFRDSAQVLVATEAAGEGINLQFCWLMVNFDIPWNPVRLEQRVGRIHRYGQEKDCLIFNFVAQNTREGRVLRKLLDRLAEIRAELGTDQVFDVVGEVFPANLLERMLRDMYARQTDEHKIQDRIVRDVSPDRFRAITESALEGLAKKDLNLSAIVGRSAEAKERRLVPEVVEQFFVEAAPESGLRLKAEGGRRKAEDNKHDVSSVLHPSSFTLHPSVYRVGKTPKNLLPIGDAQERRYGRLGREYARIVFDKELLKVDANVEWVTPGHPLFEAVRSDVLQRVDDDLRRGAVFYDLHRAEPAVLDIFAASVKDGRGNTLHRRLFGVETSSGKGVRTHLPERPEGCFAQMSPDPFSARMTLREPTYLHAITPAPHGTPTPDGAMPLPHRQLVEQFLYEHALQPWGERAAAERAAEVVRVAKHVEISLNALIDRQNIQLGEYLNRQVQGQTVPGLDGLISQAEQHLDELNNRLETRRRELELEGHAAVADITHLGRAWVLPHPERASPQLAPMIRDDDIEKIALREAIKHEEARGWVVESVETENRGFDLISRRPHPEDAKTFVEVRFIEVKGRAGVGVVALTDNEYRTAERLKNDYWLYAVFNCAGMPQLHAVENPARLGWQPVVTVEHYRLDAQAIMRTGI